MKLYLLFFALFLLYGCSNSFEELNEAGTVRLIQGNYDTAIDYFDRSIKEEPNQFTAYLNKARALSELKKYDESLKYFEIAESKQKDHPAIFFEKGKMLLKQNNYSKAILELTKAIELTPKISDYYHYRAICYSQMNKMELACEDWKTASEMGNPNSRSFMKQFCNP